MQRYAFPFLCTSYVLLLGTSLSPDNRAIACCDARYVSTNPFLLFFFSLTLLSHAYNPVNYSHSEFASVVTRMPLPPSLTSSSTNGTSPPRHCLLSCRTTSPKMVRRERPLGMLATQRTLFVLTETTLLSRFRTRSLKNPPCSLRKGNPLSWPSPRSAQC